MKRILVSLLLVGLAFGLLQIQKRVEVIERQPASLTQVIEWVESSVVYIEAYGDASYGDTIYNGVLWSGSGVIIDSDGLILTASHVVKGADRFKIILSDGRELWSEDSWCRPDISDVGFIELAAIEGLPVSCLGESFGLRKGDDVFVVGCPFGYELRFTVTKGVVSGLGRDCEGFFGEKLLFQVDAQSWPGNSGGPVYDMNGRIIGILVGGFYSADGIGLCIPVDIVSGLLDIYMAEQSMKGIE